MKSNISVDCKILCLGDIILDTYCFGEVNRISPEAPIPVLKLNKESNIIGGSGNVARNICSAGKKCHLISVSGKDSEALMIKKLLNTTENLSFELFSETGRPTTKKRRFVSGNHQILRVDQESTKPINQTLEKKIISRVKSIIAYFDIIIISDYNKGMLTKSLLEEIFKISKMKNKISIVDPKRQDFSFYSNADIITPNFKELLSANNITGSIEDTNQIILDYSKKLIKRYSFNSVLTTRSSKGITLVEKRAVHNFSSKAKEVFDVSGAGDTVVAYLAASLISGKELVESAKIANKAAGIAVGKFGTASVKINEVFDEKKNSKILSLTQAKRFLKKKELKVGFTNGCFDLIHRGHIEFLKKARSQCELLIVGLNTDFSVSTLKGPSRPIIPENERAIHLSNFSFVDIIILFNDKTPINLIKQLKPNFLFKGRDYEREDVVGGKEISKWGGKIKLLDLIKGKSTTKIVERIKNGT